MLVCETFAAAFPLARFRGLARVPEKRARVPSSARVPGVAHPCSRTSSFTPLCGSGGSVSLRHSSNESICKLSETSTIV